MINPPNPFWDFSVSLWQDPQVSRACVAIQDRYHPRADVDVNILLFCAWAAAAGHGELGDAEVRAAIATSAAWRQEVLLPLRTVRRRLRREVEPVPVAISAAVREQAGAAELEAEQIQQLMLVQLIPVPKPRPVDATDAVQSAATSIARYFARIGVVPSEADNADLGRLLGTAFPQSGG